MFIPFYNGREHRQSSIIVKGLNVPLSNRVFQVEWGGFYMPDNENRWKSPVVYGNEDGPDYFAETLGWSIYDPSQVPVNALNWMNNLIKK